MIENQLVENDMADGVGFEPTVGFPTPVFKTGSINRSDTHPRRR
jgi:hypothetical protein